MTSRLSVPTLSEVALAPRVALSAAASRTAVEPTGISGNSFQRLQSRIQIFDRRQQDADRVGRVALALAGGKQRVAGIARVVEHEATLLAGGGLERAGELTHACRAPIVGPRRPRADPGGPWGP